MQSIAADLETGVVYVGHSPAKAQVSVVVDGAIKPIASSLGSYLPGAMGLAGSRLAVVPLVWENKLAVIDLEEGTVLQQVATGIAPFAAVVDQAGTVAYVSNLGGRPPKNGEAFASPMQKPSEKVTVDARGIASTGTLTRVDLVTGEATHTIAVDLHPTAMVWDHARHRLFVANGNSDTISVVDTQSSVVTRTIAL